MAQLGLLVVFMFCMYGLVELKSITEDSQLFKNKFEPNGWRTDSKYPRPFLSDGFSWGIPESSRKEYSCQPIQMPKHGRFICAPGLPKPTGESSQKTPSRIMCMAQCEAGYSFPPEANTMLFFCWNDGIWRNLYKQNMKVTSFDCIPNIS